MKDDFSELPTNASCYAIASESVIYTYSNSVRDTYTKMGSKWLKTASSSYNIVPSNYRCFTYSDLTNINSYEVFYPFFYTIGFVLAIFAFRFIWKIIRPLFKAHM